VHRALIERARKHALTVSSLAEAGDNRLMAGDGPCGGQRPELSTEEGLRFDRAAYLLATEDVPALVVALSALNAGRPGSPR